jgi:DNA-binding transcriptional LysR family regulator
VQLQQLKYFLAVAETRHFTQAAQLTGVSQPSLSKQIHVLENELGATLFTRVRGNVTLTAAGEALLPRARRIVADLETARLEVAELVGVSRGRLRLGATPSLCTSLVAPVLRRYQETYPGVRLQVEEGGSDDLVAKLTRGQLDLALIVLPDTGTDPALITEPILRESLVIASSQPLSWPAAIIPSFASPPPGREAAASPAGAPFASPMSGGEAPTSSAGASFAAPTAGGEAAASRAGEAFASASASAAGGKQAAVRVGEVGVPLVALRDEPMVMFRVGYNLRDATLEACRRAGFEPAFAIEGGEMDAVLSFVQAGLGVALVPSMVLTGRPGLHATALAAPGIQRIIALAHRRDVTPTHAARAVRGVLHAYLTEAMAWNTLPPGVQTI